MSEKAGKAGGIVAAFINPNNAGGLDFFEKACLLWNESGRITYFGADVPPPEKLAGHEILVRERNVVLPGLIDLHTHLPQYEFAGQGAAALLPWLEHYTYPQESRFADAQVAELQSLNFFQSCLSQGTTTVVAYLSSFYPAAEIAFAEAARAGTRAYLGPALMDRNVPPALLTPPQRAEKEMLNLIQKFHGKNRTEVVVTPRFAISCSAELLTLCAEISRAHSTLLQTHISENHDEITETLRLFPEAESYAAVYDRFGCLHERTLLGHGIHLSEAELSLIGERQSVIVHCPVSNSFLGSGVMPWRRYRALGLRTGLGTDVAAGYSLSLINEAKVMTESAKLRAHFTGEDAALPVTAAVYQATLGNANAIGRSDLGSFAAGKMADLIVIDDSLCDTLLTETANAYSTLPERLQRIVYRGHNEMVRETLIEGKITFAR